MTCLRLTSSLLFLFVLECWFMENVVCWFSGSIGFIVGLPVSDELDQFMT